MNIQDRIKNHVCCFCEAELPFFEPDGTPWGHNPRPACTEEDAECCDYCSWNIVVPARAYGLTAEEIDELVISVVANKTDEAVKEFNGFHETMVARMMAAGLTVDAQDQLIEHIKGMYDAGQHRKASSDRNDELRGLIDMLLDMMKDNNHALEEAYLFLNRLYGRS